MTENIFSETRPLIERFPSMIKDERRLIDRWKAEIAKAEKNIQYMLDEIQKQQT